MAFRTRRSLLDEGGDGVEACQERRKKEKGGSTAVKNEAVEEADEGRSW